MSKIIKKTKINKLHNEKKFKKLRVKTKRFQLNQNQSQNLFQTNYLLEIQNYQRLIKKSNRSIPTKHKPYLHD